MTAVASSIGPSAYWYLTRSTGWVSLLLLTASVVLGVIDVNRWSTREWPRFVLDSLHRSVSLLVLVFLALHILTAVLDSFAPITLVDALVPFLGSYRPLWLGLGAVAFDLLLALTITSVMRRRVGHRAWRVIHWLAYACWPVALVHSLGTGSDVKSAWALALTAICVLAVTAAVGARALRGWPEHARLRGGALGLSALVPVALIVWLPGGPLGHGWARRAGTPVSLLRSSSAGRPSAVATGPARKSTPSSGSGSLGSRFVASLSGTIKQGPGPAPGLISIEIATSFTGSVAGRLEIEMDGPPAGEGGVSLQSSSVTLGSPPTPVVYHGSILALDGNRMLANVRDAEGHSLTLQIDLAVDAAAGTVSGTLASKPATGR
jgi:DMSO/TMAO reductase YedYZ heme-binding membrane subunit